MDIATHAMLLAVVAMHLGSKGSSEAFRVCASVLLLLEFWRLLHYLLVFRAVAYLADIWDARQLVIPGQAADAGAGPHGLMATGTAP
jgi:hypothetical protein